MPPVPCPHCERPIPKGARVCHHCLQDVPRGTRARSSAFRRLATRASAPVGARARRFVLLLRMAFALAAWILVQRTFARLEGANPVGDPGAWLLGRLFMPGVTLFLLGLGFVRVGRDPFLWTVFVAGLLSPLLLEDVYAGRAAAGWTRALVGVLWLMAFGAPSIAREIQGRADPKFVADDRRVVAQVLIVYGGLLAALAAFRFQVIADLTDWLMGDALFWVALAGVGFLACLAEGPQALVGALGRGLDLRGAILVVPAVAAMLAFALLYVAWGRGSWWPPWPTVRPAPGWILALFVFAPAVFEEFLVRGVLWNAVRERAGPRATIVVTAALFALCHLDAPVWQAAALPVQFVGGLCLGWLRHRAGALLPCMAAHAAYNAAVLSLDFAA